MSYSNGDLHIHSNQSDWILSVSEIIDHVNNTFKKWIFSITDHNILTLKKPIKLWSNYWIPWIEISTHVDWESIHITGYSKNPFVTEDLKNMLYKIQKWYNNRAKKIHKKINKLWYKLPPLYKLRDTKLPWPINSYDIISAVWTLINEYDNKKIKEWCKKNGNLLFVQEKNFMPEAKDVIKILHEANFVVFWAHPGNRLFKNKLDLNHSKTIYCKLIKYNIDWIEVYAPKHTKQQIKLLKKLAKKDGLLISWGSDFHWRNNDDKITSMIDKTNINKLESKLNSL